MTVTNRFRGMMADPSRSRRIPNARDVSLGDLSLLRRIPRLTSEVRMYGWRFCRNASLSPIHHLKRHQRIPPATTTSSLPNLQTQHARFPRGLTSSFSVTCRRISLACNRCVQGSTNVEHLPSDGTHSIARRSLHASCYNFTLPA